MSIESAVKGTVASHRFAHGQKVQKHYFRQKEIMSSMDHKMIDHFSQERPLTQHGVVNGQKKMKKGYSEIRRGVLTNGLCLAARQRRTPRSDCWTSLDARGDHSIPKVKQKRGTYSVTTKGKIKISIVWSTLSLQFRIHLSNIYQLLSDDFTVGDAV